MAARQRIGRSRPPFSHHDVGRYVEMLRWSAVDDWRDVYETGEPPPRALHAYAEHTNNLAQPGTQAEVGDGYLRFRDRRPKLRRGLDIVERAHAEHVWAQQRTSVQDTAMDFDVLYRRTIAEVRRTRERGARVVPLRRDTLHD